MLRQKEDEERFNRKLFAMLATGYIGRTSFVHEDGVFLMELKECSKCIYEVTNFIFLVLVYVIEHILSMSQLERHKWLSKNTEAFAF